jgi:hypothetical protein
MRGGSIMLAMFSRANMADRVVCFWPAACAIAARASAGGCGAVALLARSDEVVAGSCTGSCSASVWRSPPPAQAANPTATAMLNIKLPATRDFMVLLLFQ